VKQISTQIADEIIEKSWSEISSLFVAGAEKKFQEAVESLHASEPVVADFVTEAFASLSPDGADLGFFATLVVWRSFELSRLGEKSRSPVSPERMSECFRTAQAWGLREEEVLLLEKKIRDPQAYAQPHLMRYVLDAVLDCQEDGLDLDPEDQERLLVCLKAVVDAFSSVV
jgi:hypothetical protein